MSSALSFCQFTTNPPPSSTQPLTTCCCHHQPLSTWSAISPAYPHPPLLVYSDLVTTTSMMHLNSAASIEKHHHDYCCSLSAVADVCTITCFHFCHATAAAFSPITWRWFLTHQILTSKVLSYHGSLWFAAPLQFLFPILTSLTFSVFVSGSLYSLHHSNFSRFLISLLCDVA